LEVIVVDDASTDGTWELLRQFAASLDDKRLKIVNRAPGGVSAARNSALALAKGRYIGFLDGDDVWRSDKASRQLEIMEADPSIAFTFTDSQYITENGELTGRYIKSGKSEIHLHDIIRRNYVGNGSTPIVRRECIDLAGPFGEELESCEDYEMWCRILYVTGSRAVLIPDS